MNNAANKIISFANCDLTAMEVKDDHVYLINNVDHSPQQAKQELQNALSGFSHINAVFICVDGDTSISQLNEADMAAHGWYRQPQEVTQ